MFTKTLKISFFVFFLFLIGGALAFADITFDPTSSQPTGTLIVPTCDLGNTVILYDPDGNLIQNYPCNGSSTFSDSVARTDTIVECTVVMHAPPIPSRYCAYDTLTEAEIADNFDYETTFSFSASAFAGFLDNSVDTFFSNSGGLNFLGTIFAIPVIFAIVASMIRPFIV